MCDKRRSDSSGFLKLSSKYFLLCSSQQYFKMYFVYCVSVYLMMNMYSFASCAYWKTDKSDAADSSPSKALCIVFENS